MPSFDAVSKVDTAELTNAVDEATHRVLFGRVIDIRENEENATLLYCMRRYISG